MSAAGGAGSSGPIAGAQSTVFVTMGVDQGGGDCVSDSITGTIFGLSIQGISAGSGFGGLNVNAAGSASGQAFFRLLKVGSTSQTTASCVYTSGTNNWGFSNLILSPLTSYTLQFFR